jgi:prostamide/prostaglandin F2alpha synthase
MAPTTKAMLSKFSASLITNAKDLNVKVPFSSLWKEKPVILLFIRRLGCPICRMYLQEVENAKAAIEKKGAHAVCITWEALGESASDKDRSFEKSGYWTGPVYTLDKEVFAELFGRRGMFDNLYGLLDMDADALKKVKDRKIQGNYSGDGFQLGGQMIVDVEGSVHLDHRPKAYGDDTEVDDLLDALDKCARIKQ